MASNTNDCGLYDSENFGRLEGITLVYVGDGRNNMANSLLVTGAILGVNVRICAPKELFPSDEVVNYAKEFAKESGAELMITDDVAKGVKGANVLYTDVWVSMVKKINLKNVSIC